MCVSRSPQRTLLLDEDRTHSPAVRIALSAITLLFALPILALRGSAPAAQDVPEVAVIRAVPTTAPREVVLPGSFEAFEEVRLYARVTGYLAEVRVDIGDRVKARSVLAQMHLPEMDAEVGRAEADLAAARAELRRAEAAARLADITHRRLSDLKTSEPKAVTQQDVDVAAAEAEVALALAEGAAAAIEVAKAKLAHLEAMIGYARIRAPFDGVIVRRFVDPGALVVAGSEGGEPILEVASTDRLRLILSIPEALVPAVRPGVEAVVTVDALPGREFTGTISRIAGALAIDTRNMRAEIDMGAGDGGLRPGMYASVRLLIEQAGSIYSLPASAIRRDGADTFVWSVHDGQIVRKDVEMIENDAVRAIVRAQFTAGTQVVVTAPVDLKQGQPARTREAEATP